jgi:hypothetical protein
MNFSEARNAVFDLNQVEGQLCEVSISHDNDTAQAVAMVPPMPWLLGKEEYPSKGKQSYDGM